MATPWRSVKGCAGLAAETGARFARSELTFVAEQWCRRMAKFRRILPAQILLEKGERIQKYLLQIFIRGEACGHIPFVAAGNIRPGKVRRPSQIDKKFWWIRLFIAAVLARDGRRDAIIKFPALKHDWHPNRMHSVMQDI